MRTRIGLFAAIFAVAIASFARLGIRPGRCPADDSARIPGSVDFMEESAYSAASGLPSETADQDHLEEWDDDFSCRKITNCRSSTASS